MSTGQNTHDVTTPAATGREPGEKRPSRGRRRRRRVAGLLFLAPALVFLGAFIVYPLFFTMVRSTLSRGGDEFVAFDNYAEMFTSTETLTALRNNAIWVLVAPAVATALGLLFAVLTERVRWGTAFKTIIFLPMAISFLAVGIIFRLVYEDAPERGLINAAVQGVVHVFQPPGEYPGARPSTDDLDTADGAILAEDVEPGSSVPLGLEGIAPALVPEAAEDAVVEPEVSDEAVAGVVWRDFSADGDPGNVDEGELGLPGVRVSLLDGDGASSARRRPSPTAASRFPQMAMGGSPSGSTSATSANPSEGSRGSVRRWSHRPSSPPSCGCGPGSR